MEGTESPLYGGGDLGGQDQPEDEDLTGGFAQADDLEGYEDAWGATADDDVTVPDAAPSSRAAQPLVFRRQRNAQPAQPFQRLQRGKASKFHPKNLAPQQHTRFKGRPRDAPRSQGELQALQEEELLHRHVQPAGEQQQLGRLRLQQQQDQRPSLSDPTGGLPASPLCLLQQAAAAVSARGPVGSAGVTPRCCTSQHSGPLAPSGRHLLPPAAADALDTLSEPLAQVGTPLAAAAAAAAAAAGARAGSMTSQASSREALIDQLLQQLAAPVQQEQLQPVSALQLHSEWQQLLHESNLTAGVRQQRPAAAAEPGLSLSAAMGVPRVSPFDQSLDVSLLHLSQHLQPRQQLLHSGTQLDALFARHLQGSHTLQQQQQRGHLAGLLAGSPRAGDDAMARLAQLLAPQPQQHTHASHELQQQLQAQRRVQAAQLQELQHLTQDLGASLPPQQQQQQQRQQLATLGSLGLSFSGAPASSGPSSSSAASMQHRLELLLRQHSSSVCLPPQQPDQGLPASRPAGTAPPPGTSTHDTAAAAAGSERDARAARQKAGVGVVRGLLVELCRDLAPAAAKEVQAIIVQQAKQAAAAAARAGRPFTATDAVSVMVQSRQAVAPALGSSGSTSSLNRLDSGMLASFTGGSFSSQRSNSTTYPGAAAAAAAAGAAGAASVSGQLRQQQLLYLQQQLPQLQQLQLQQPQRHTPTPTAAAAAAGPCFADAVMAEQARARKSPAAAAAAAEAEAEAEAAEAAGMSESSAVASCDAAMGSGEAAASGEATSGSDGGVTDPGEAPAAAAAEATAAAAAAEATAAPAAAGAAEARADAPGIIPPW